MPCLLHFVFYIICFLGGTAKSHFVLQYPNSLGFDANNEDSGPCGGFSVTFANASDYRIGGDAIALTTLHPQSNFLFRATLDTTASGNWTNFLPVVGEYGLGSFCEARISAPAAWAGAQGIIQVIQDAEDGVHYQCAAVNFIAGMLASLPSSCTNGSTSASFTTDTVLNPASGSGSSGSTSTGTATSSKAIASALASATGKSGAESAFRGVTRSSAWLLSVLVLHLAMPL